MIRDSVVLALRSRIKSVRWQPCTHCKIKPSSGVYFLQYKENVGLLQLCAGCAMYDYPKACTGFMSPKLQGIRLVVGRRGQGNGRLPKLDVLKATWNATHYHVEFYLKGYRLVAIKVPTKRASRALCRGIYMALRLAETLNKEVEKQADKISWSEIEIRALRQPRLKEEEE